MQHHHKQANALDVGLYTARVLMLAQLSETIWMNALIIWDVIHVALAGTFG
jgi:hypothetical protein